MRSPSRQARQAGDQAVLLRLSRACHSAKEGRVARGRVDAHGLVISNEGASFTTMSMRATHSSK